MALIEPSRKVKDWISSNQAKWLIDALTQGDEAFVPNQVPKVRKYGVLIINSDGEGHVMCELFVTHPGAHACPPLQLEGPLPAGFWKFALRTTYEQVHMTFKEER